MKKAYNNNWLFHKAGKLCKQSNMAQVKVDLECNCNCSIGEGPHWDDVTQTLLFVDIPKSSVLRWNPATKKMKSVIVKEPSVGAVVPRRRGGLVVAAGHRFSFLNEDTGELEVIEEVSQQFPLSRFNDGKCDPVGRFWAGTMGLEKVPGNPRKGEGVLYCLDKDKNVTKHLEPLDIANGLSWSSDHQTMYYCDTLRFSIDAYDYDITNGKMSNMREVVKFDKSIDGYPDGHCIDSDGNLWVAMFFTGQILKIDTTAGKITERIKVSDTAVKTTSVCFGGPNMDEMFVTSARNNPVVESEESDCSGSLFKITGLGAKGLPANVYEG